jgi:hypothetical protein
MTETAERMLDDLGLAHRRLLMCTGDMGFTQAKKYDLEVWSPGQARWLEVSSVSNMEAFQAARLEARAVGPAAPRGRARRAWCTRSTARRWRSRGRSRRCSRRTRRRRATSCLPPVLQRYLGERLA